MDDITVLLTLTSTYTMDSATSSSSARPANYVTTTLVTAVATMRSAVAPPSGITPSTVTPSMFAPSVVMSSMATASTLSTPSISAATSASSSLSVSDGTSPLPTLVDGIIKDSSKSMQLGLAVGLPLAVISVFGLAVLVFILVQKRKFLNKDAQYDDGPNYVFDWTKDDLEASKNVPRSMDLSDDATLPKRTAPQPTAREKVRDRLSKVINLRDVKDEEQRPQNFRDSILSPMFLKRFKLRNLPDNIKAQSAYVDDFPAPRNKRNLKLLPVVAAKGSPSYIVIRDYTKNLKDELTVNVGQMAHILETFSDKWCKVQLATGEKGLVPCMCLQAL